MRDILIFVGIGCLVVVAVIVAIRLIRKAMEASD